MEAREAREASDRSIRAMLDDSGRVAQPSKPRWLLGLMVSLDDVPAGDEAQHLAAAVRALADRIEATRRDPLGSMGYVSGGSPSGGASMAVWGAVDTDRPVFSDECAVSLELAGRDEQGRIEAVAAIEGCSCLGAGGTAQEALLMAALSFAGCEQQWRSALRVAD